MARIDDLGLSRDEALQQIDFFIVDRFQVLRTEKALLGHHSGFLLVDWLVERCLVAIGSANRQTYQLLLERKVFRLDIFLVDIDLRKGLLFE